MAEDDMLYGPPSPRDLIDALTHLCGLFRRSGRDIREGREQGARESFCKDLIDNLRRVGARPTPHTLFHVSRYFRLTIDSAYRLFGYDLSAYRRFDILLHDNRTRLIESHPYAADFDVELPFLLGHENAFERNALLKDLVLDWRSPVSIRALENNVWRDRAMLYAQIGREDHLGPPIPPGSFVSVEPIREEERQRPDPAAIYLLQFSGGYRCAGCVVMRGRLFLLLHDHRYVGRHEFLYPTEVAIIGRVRMFAVRLPRTGVSQWETSQIVAETTPLKAPWKCHTLPELFKDQCRSLGRPEERPQAWREVLESGLQTRLTDRTLRRYRRPTKSVPHTSTLIALALAYGTRYSDVLRVLGYALPESKLYSLEALLRVMRLPDLASTGTPIDAPVPQPLWTALLRRWGEWPTLLSMEFPRLRQWQGNVLHLQQSRQFNGLDPLLPAGSFLLLEDVDGFPEGPHDRTKANWERPIYAVRSGEHIFCSYLEVEPRQIVLIPHPQSLCRRITIPRAEIDQVSLVVGAAVPL